MQDHFREPWEQMKDLIQKNGGTPSGYEFIAVDVGGADLHAMSVYVNLKLPDDLQVQCLVIGNILRIITPDRQHNTPFSDTMVIGRVCCSQETIKDKQLEVYKLDLHTKDKTTGWPYGGFDDYIRFWLPTLLALKSELSVELVNVMTNIREEDGTLTTTTTGIRIGCIGFDAIKTLT